MKSQNKNPKRKRQLVERRSPQSLKLEIAIMKALFAAKWSGERIAGFISAQRRDGVLRIIVAHHIVDIELMIWERANDMHVARQTRIEAALAAVRRYQHAEEGAIEG